MDKKPILTRRRIINKINLRMKEYLQDKKHALKDGCLSEALISDHYFFALLFLKEDILGKKINYHKEIKRCSQTHREKKQ